MDAITATYRTLFMIVALCAPHPPELPPAQRALCLT